MSKLKIYGYRLLAVSQVWCMVLLVVGSMTVVNGTWFLQGGANGTTPTETPLCADTSCHHAARAPTPPAPATESLKGNRTSQDERNQDYFNYYRLALYSGALSVMSTVTRMIIFITLRILTMSRGCFDCKLRCSQLVYMSWIWIIRMFYLVHIASITSAVWELPRHMALALASLPPPAAPGPAYAVMLHLCAGGLALAALATGLGDVMLEFGERFTPSPTPAAAPAGVPGAPAAANHRRSQRRRNYLQQIMMR